MELVEVENIEKNKIIERDLNEINYGNNKDNRNSNFRK